MTKNLFSNRTPFEKCYLIENVKQLSFIPGNRNLRMAHVKNIFKAFLNLPCLSLPKERYWMVSIVSQHFVWYPDSKAALPVMVVNVDESALLSAIKFNSEHANWVIEDYLEKGIHGYEQLHDFYLEFEIKAAIQLIKGKYSTKEFKEGALKISDEEYMEASKKAAALCLISAKLNTKVVFRRGGILPRPNIQTYVKRLSLFKMPLTESRKEWERAYEDLLR